MMMLATWSSTAVPRKMIRSLSRREKMSQPRSPRWVCSMTVGMMKLPVAGGGASKGPNGWRSLMVFFRFLFASGSGRGRRFSSRLIGGHDEPGRIFVGDLSLSDQHIKRLLFDDLVADLVDAVVLLQVGAQLLRIFLARGRDLRDALLDVGVGRGDALALGDRLHQDRAPRFF